MSSGFFKNRISGKHTVRHTTDGCNVIDRTAKGARRSLAIFPLTTPMHSLKLCTASLRFAASATFVADAGAHGYNAGRNLMSESGALNRRIAVLVDYQDYH